jgi:glycosyltransferase involved in cell wall biosynthesis
MRRSHGLLETWLALALRGGAWHTDWMRDTKQIAVVIPALNEERAIGLVVRDLPGWVDQIIIADNGSTDATAATAQAAGAMVVHEAEKGYGAACLTGIAAAGQADIIVFMDGDYSDYGEDLHLLVDPIIAGTHDFVLASRMLGERESGSLTPQQQFGNWLATTLIRAIWRVRYTDLGPYRAIRRDALERLQMADRNYGWTVEMQIKAAEAGLRFIEVPGRYRRRIGVSKVSGTIKGSVMAGYKILSIIGRYAFRPALAKT